MTFTEPSFDTDLDVEGFEPTEAERLNITSEVDRIRPLIEEFPTQILHINLGYNSGSEEYEVKLALVLPGQTFATGDVSQAWEPSLEKSVQKMIRRIEHYKATMSGELKRVCVPEWGVGCSVIRKSKPRSERVSRSRTSSKKPLCWHSTVIKSGGPKCFSGSGSKR